MSKLNFVILYGSNRADREGIRAVKFIEDVVARRGHSSERLDSCELNLPILDKMYKEYEPGTAPDNLERMARAIEKADAVLVVTGEYNHAPPPGLKNMLDHFLEEWFFRPSAIVSYSVGRFGGVRASVLLRIILAELGMPTISSILPIARIDEVLSEDGDAIDVAMTKSADRFMEELEWYTRALARARREGTPF